MQIIIFLFILKDLCDGSIKYPCTGTILNERTVLTTATCALANSDDYKL